MSDPLKCPTCESPDPRMHPATQAEGEVTAICPDPFHAEHSARVIADTSGLPDPSGIPNYGAAGDPWADEVTSR